MILSSTYSLVQCTNKDFLYDYLIIDESSQVNLATAILSMSVAKNVVVVGDCKQLPQIDDISFKNRNEKLLQEYNIPKSYSYFGNSILSSLLTLSNEKIKKVILKEHYRCAPDIINFCNEEFYDNQLIIYSENLQRISDSNSRIIKMKVIKTAPGNHAYKNPNGSGYYNQREIDEINNLLKAEKLNDVGVITPYSYQAELIQNKFGNLVEASTIHKFQGREKKTIIFSSVVNDVNDFVENENLINVAVSRAKDYFVLITSDKIAKTKKGVLSDLINYISYHENFGKIEMGNVKSIYDILYSDYEKELNEFRKKHPSKLYDSENITKNLLEEILKNNEYKNLHFNMHVSLNDFINIKKISSKLSIEENKFLKNPKSHVDFLIYNKLSMKPTLVIEVDGITYHEKNKKQLGRDALKDNILKCVDIPILRLKTNESNERERIENKINEILK